MLNSVLNVKIGGGRPPPPNKKRTNHQPARNADGSLLERAKDERRGTDERKTPLHHGAENGSWQTLQNTNCFRPHTEAQDKDGLLTSFVHPKGDSLHSRKTNGHGRTNHKAQTQASRTTRHKTRQDEPQTHKKPPSAKTPQTRNLLERVGEGRMQPKITRGQKL